MLQTSNPSLKSPMVMPGIPWIGNALSFVSANGVSVEFLLQAQRECGDVAHFKAMNQSFYLVSDPDLVRQVLLERVQEFPKPEAVIQETMRIQPTVAMIPRFIDRDMSLGDYQLKAGSFVLISPYVLHRDPRRWNSPDNFVPIRFSEDNEKKIEKYAYLPFGGGPRICIGNHFALMEAHILLALIVSRFHLRLASGAKIEPLRYVTCAPKHGLPMVIEHRGS